MRSSARTRLAALLAAAAAAAALVPGGAAAYNGAVHDQNGDPSPVSQRHIVRLLADEAAISTARTDNALLSTQKPGDAPLAGMVLRFQQEDAAYNYRQAIRAEQADLLRVAADPALADAVVAGAPAPLSYTVRDAVGAWHSMWRLAGIDEYNLVRIHPHGLAGAQPTETLITYYKQSAQHFQIDWTLLAAINFIESDFGRITGPSSAGALGPMQFMPATWDAYGQGDVNNPKDAIEAAARYLFLSGARRNIESAIYAYNHDKDYVAAVEYYADVIRIDPTWLDRLYYWNTTG